jgi:hypothetical protein
LREAAGRACVTKRACPTLQGPVGNADQALAGVGLKTRTLLRIT